MGLGGQYVGLRVRSMGLGGQYVGLAIKYGAGGQYVGLGVKSMGLGGHYVGRGVAIGGAGDKIEGAEGAVCGAVSLEGAWLPVAPPPGAVAPPPDAVAPPPSWRRRKRSCGRWRRRWSACAGCSEPIKTRRCPRGGVVSKGGVARVVWAENWMGGGVVLIWEWGRGGCPGVEKRGGALRGRQKVGGTHRGTHRDHWDP